MKFSKALKDFITAITGISALVGTRVYFRSAPANATMPYVIFNQISKVKNGITLNKYRYRISCISDNYATSVQIADLIGDILPRQKGILSGTVTCEYVFHQERFDLTKDESNLGEIVVDDYIIFSLNN